MEWKQLISNKRFGQEHKHAERHDDRSEFKRDYDRLIFSPRMMFFVNGSCADGSSATNIAVAPADFDRLVITCP